ncbi:MAG: MBL fold metallo-hydrolase [Pseudomonadota bacterium]
MTFTRRQALATSAALPAAALSAPAVFAAADKMGPSMGKHNRFLLGDYEVTTLLVGTSERENPHGMFGVNVSPEEFARVSEENFIPHDRAQAYFTPTIVNTGDALILFDTGLSPEGTSAAMAEAGYSPDQVDTVIITHMHPDHIGGLMGEGGETFSNAAYITGAVEHNFWTGTPNERIEAKVIPLNDKFSFIDAGASVAPGITAVDTSGHTPGHMAYMIESGGKQMLLVADMVAHPVWSLAYPDWQFKFDADKEAAVQTRRRVLDMLAAEKMPFIGYHMPFPAIGYVESRDGGFRYVPAANQTMF